MDTNTKKEEFSYGYLKMIGAKSGLAIENHNRFNSSISTKKLR
jgi:hypothetical protein